LLVVADEAVRETVSRSEVVHRDLLGSKRKTQTAMSKIYHCLLLFYASKSLAS
jgi:hypothetical protein